MQLNHKVAVVTSTGRGMSQPIAPGLAGEGVDTATAVFRKQELLHHRHVPLAEAITLDTEQRDTNGFINECEGHCGL